MTVEEDVVRAANHFGEALALSRVLTTIPANTEEGRCGKRRGVAVIGKKPECSGIHVIGFVVDIRFRWEIRLHEKEQDRHKEENDGQMLHEPRERALPRTGFQFSTPEPNDGKSTWRFGPRC